MSSLPKSFITWFGMRFRPKPEQHDQIRVGSTTEFASSSVVFSVRHGSNHLEPTTNVQSFVSRPLSM